MKTKNEKAEVIVHSDTSTNEDAYSKFMDEIIACVNALNPQLSANQRKLKSKEQHISVDKQNRFKRLVKINVTEKDLNNMPKFNEVIREEPLYASTCGLSRSQIVLIAKILRLNLENDTEVKAEFRF